MIFKFKLHEAITSPAQKYTSAATSINSSKTPAVFSLVNFKPDTINLDYGGGRFDTATRMLANKGVTNLIYDPYNRSKDHNEKVIETIEQNGGADTATCSNVLNVIEEENVRRVVLQNIKKLLKPHEGVAYITVYEGNGSGEGAETKAGYQQNKKTAEYVSEVEAVFGNAQRRGKVIIARV